MRHATLRACAKLAGGTLQALPLAALACGAGETEAEEPVFMTFDALAMMASAESVGACTFFKLVDCPRCRVLLDAALEGRLL